MHESKPKYVCVCLVLIESAAVGVLTPFYYHVQGAYNSGKHGNVGEFVHSGKLREFKISYCIECRQPVLYRCSMRCRLPVLELIAVYSAGVHERVYFSVTS